MALARGVVEELVDADARDVAVETLAFSFRGVDYEVDLSAKDARAMERALAPYLEAARRAPAPRLPATRRVAGRRASRGRTEGAVGTHPAARDVRAWARAQGIEVSERGRVSAGVMSQYHEAHHR